MARALRAFPAVARPGATQGSDARSSRSPDCKLIAKETEDGAADMRLRAARRALTACMIREAAETLA